jgi:hypothetical protein
MKNTGKEFEDLTATIFEALSGDSSYESIERDVFLDGPDGKRQIDVLLKGKMGPFDCITIIECKDYNKNVNVTAIDALHSKMQDVNAQKAVFVARKGFSSGAKKKAKRLGISLCTAHNTIDEKWKFGLELPFIIREKSLKAINPQYQLINPPRPIEKLDILHINGKHLYEIIDKHWSSKDFDNSTLSQTIALDQKEKYYLSTTDGSNIEAHNININLEFENTIYFGYFNDLDSSKLLNYVESDNAHVIFDLNELANYRATCAKYNSEPDIPSVANISSFDTKILINPSVNFKPSVREALRVAG